MKARMKIAALSAALALGASLAVPALAEDVVSLPNLSYRTGPFAATGIPLMNGQRDYMLMLNARDGGVNGVKLGYEECETGYNTEKGVECYEKTKAAGIVTQPWSTGITLQVLPKSNVDKIPILAPGYGFSPMTDGKVFQWAFNMPATYWDGASMILQYVAEGNLDNLKGDLKDFLFISPYNAQVRSLQTVLPDGARVGSVDKFQGQEAPVCILSLCSSFGEYGSRGLGFILDQNRVNVAISRAQCLAVVVADPRIADTRANSIAEMKLLNLFCKLTAVGAVN